MNEIDGMGPAQARSVFRWVHLVLAVILGVYFYSSLRLDSNWTNAMRFIVFPAFAITGLVMWQQGRITKFLRDRRAKRVH